MRNEIDENILTGEVNVLGRLKRKTEVYGKEIKV